MGGKAIGLEGEAACIPREEVVIFGVVGSRCISRYGSLDDVDRAGDCTILARHGDARGAVKDSVSTADSRCDHSKSIR